MAKRLSLLEKYSPYRLFSMRKVKQRIIDFTAMCASCKCIHNCEILNKLSSSILKSELRWNDDEVEIVNGKVVCKKRGECNDI